MEPSATHAWAKVVLGAPGCSQSMGMTATSLVKAFTVRGG